jgi:hypothetical protein
MKRDAFGTFLTIASLALAVLVVLLAVQNRGLKEDLAACQTGHGMPPDALKTGDMLGSVSVFDPDGNKTALDLSSGMHVLLVYSSTCPACEETLPTWNAWLENGTDPPTAGATTAPSPAALRLPVHLVDRGADDPLRRVYAVPCTIVVGPGGKVRAAVYGVPTEDDAETVRKAARG